MTICDVYLGDLDDPKFKWDGGDWDGNTPAAVLDSFPSASGSYNSAYHRWLEGHPEVVWKQTDYGGWVAKVTKAQVLDYIECAYSTSHATTAKALKRCKRDVIALPGRIYALVATEV